MPDITVPPSRSFRADRRLIATLTSDPQLMRYLENLGIDAGGTIPDFLAELLGLIIDAAESAGSAQGTAIQAIQRINELSGELQLLDVPSKARVLTLMQKVDELEAALLDLKAPDPNNVPFYGTWTPILTFAVPGNLAVTYGAQSGTYVRIGRQVMLTFIITTSAFTFTTASGNLQITGFPLASTVPAQIMGPLDWQGITKAGYTSMSSIVATGSGVIQVAGAGSGLGRSLVVAADMPSGGSVLLSGTISLTV